MHAENQLSGDSRSHYNIEKEYKPIYKGSQISSQNINPDMIHQLYQQIFKLQAWPKHSRSRSAEVHRSQALEISKSQCRSVQEQLTNRIKLKDDQFQEVKIYAENLQDSLYQELMMAKEKGELFKPKSYLIVLPSPSLKEHERPVNAVFNQIKSTLLWANRKLGTNIGVVLCEDKEKTYMKQLSMHVVFTTYEVIKKFLDQDRKTKKSHLLEGFGYIILADLPNNRKDKLFDIVKSLKKTFQHSRPLIKLHVQLKIGENIHPEILGLIKKYNEYHHAQYQRQIFTFLHSKLPKLKTREQLLMPNFRLPVFDSYMEKIDLGKNVVKQNFYFDTLLLDKEKNSNIKFKLPSYQVRQIDSVQSLMEMLQEQYQEQCKMSYKPERQVTKFCVMRVKFKVGNSQDTQRVVTKYILAPSEYSQNIRQGQVFKHFLIFDQLGDKGITEFKKALQQIEIDKIWTEVELSTLDYEHTYRDFFTFYTMYQLAKVEYKLPELLGKLLALQNPDLISSNLQSVVFALHEKLVLNKFVDQTFLESVQAIYEDERHFLSDIHLIPGKLVKEEEGKLDEEKLKLELRFEQVNQMWLDQGFQGTGPKKSPKGLIMKVIKNVIDMVSSTVEVERNGIIDSIKQRLVELNHDKEAIILKSYLLLKKNELQINRKSHHEVAQKIFEEDTKNMTRSYKYVLMKSINSQVSYLIHDAGESFFDVHTADRQEQKKKEEKEKEAKEEKTKKEKEEKEKKEKEVKEEQEETKKMPNQDQNKIANEEKEVKQAVPMPERFVEVLNDEEYNQIQWKIKTEENEMFRSIRYLKKSKPRLFLSKDVVPPSTALPENSNKPLPKIDEEIEDSNSEKDQKVEKKEEEKKSDKPDEESVKTIASMQEELYTQQNPEIYDFPNVLLYGDSLRKFIEMLKNNHTFSEEFARSIRSNQKIIFQHQPLVQQELQAYKLIDFDIERKVEYINLIESMRGGLKSEQWENSLEFLNERHPYAFYGQALFDFLAMVTIVVPESKAGKYEDNMRKQVGIERNIKIIEHLKFPLLIKLRGYYEDKIHEFIPLLSHLQKQKTLSKIKKLTFSKFIESIPQEETQDEFLSSHHSNFTLPTKASTNNQQSSQYTVFALQNNETPQWLNFLAPQLYKYYQNVLKKKMQPLDKNQSEDSKDLFVWKEPHKIKDELDYVNDFFGKLAFEQGTTFLFKFIRTQNILNRDIDKIEANLRKTDEEFIKQFGSSQKVDSITIQKFQEKFLIVNENYVKAALLDQSNFDHLDKKVILLQMLELLGMYLYRLFLIRFFMEDFSLFDYSLKKLDLLLAFLESVNLPSLILTENGLLELLQMTFKDKNKQNTFKEMKDTLSKLPQIRNESRLDEREKYYFRVGTYRFLFDPDIHDVDHDSTDERIREQKKRKKKRKAEEIEEVIGIEEDPFEKKIIYFSKNSSTTVGIIMGTLSFDHNPLKNYFFRILASHYLSGRDLKASFNYFKNLLEGPVKQGDNRINFTNALKLRVFQKEDPKAFSSLYLHPRAITIDWSHIVKLVKSKYYTHLFPPHYSYESKAHPGGTFYTGSLGNFMIVKIKFPSAIALNISKFYIHFYTELLILFNYVEMKAKDNKSLITERLLIEFKKSLREIQDRIDKTKEEKQKQGIPYEDEDEDDLDPLFHI